MMTDSVFVVMESGSDWPDWLAMLEPASTRAVVQQEGESSVDLTDRVTARLEDFMARGDQVSVAVIACSERVDAAAEWARRAMARAVLSAMARQARPSLALTASQRKSGGSRRMLSEMAMDLEHEWQEAGARVAVRFGEPSRKPQEFWDDATSRVA